MIPLLVIQTRVHKQLRNGNVNENQQAVVDLGGQNQQKIVTGTGLLGLYESEMEEGRDSWADHDWKPGVR